MGGASQSPEGNRKAPLNEPSVILDLCQILRKILEFQAQDGVAGYTPKHDATYRRAREALLRLLKGEPCLTRLAKTAGQLLPDSLVTFIHVGLSEWDNSYSGGRLKLVQLQGQMLTALEAAGRSPTWEAAQASAAPAERVANPVTKSGAFSNRAQRRAADRREQARKLRDEGRFIKEIAKELRCSERTVSGYLQDSQ